MNSDVLSSDILEQQFGPTELVVLRQDDTSRIISTCIKASGQVLELSCVNFVLSGVGQFDTVHQAIMAGESMGKAFRASGVIFRRQEQAAYQHSLPANIENFFDSDKPGTVVALSIMAGQDKILYAEILEIYSPVVKWPKLHGQSTPEQLDKIELLNTFLNKI